MKKKAFGLVAASMLLAAAPVLADQATDTSSGVTMNLKGITVNLGGFLEAASIYRSKNLNSDLPSPLQKLPLSNLPGYYQDETRFSARQSRLSLLVKGDVNPDIHLAGYYEMDFLGAANTANSNESNSYNPRIRHLYTTADWDKAGLHLLAGQTWSLVTMNGKGITPRTEVTPLGIEAQYVPGFTWARQPQVRIVKDWDQKYWLGLSVENGQTTTGGNLSQTTATKNYANGNNTTAGGGFANAPSNNPYPDFVVKAAVDPGWGHFEVYDLIRVFESSLPQGTTAVHNTFRATNAIGGGFILPLVPKQLNLQASGIAGKGIGRYGSAQLPDVTQISTGENVPLTGYQLLTGLTYDPTAEWNFYGYYGREQVQQEIDSASIGYGSPINDHTGTFNTPITSDIKYVQQGTVGAWWKFYQGQFGKMQAGLQYSYTQDKYFAANKGGAPSANDNMVYTSLRYYWQ